MLVEVLACLSAALFFLGVLAAAIAVASAPRGFPRGDSSPGEETVVPTAWANRVILALKDGDPKRVDIRMRDGLGRLSTRTLTDEVHGVDFHDITTMQ